MANRRGKSQARRSGGSGGLPGWAWMVLGVLLTLGVVLLAPRLLRGDGEDGFYRPRPNPDAQPAAASGADEDSPLPPALNAGDAPAAPAADAADPEPEYDFYTLLPGQEVPMTDAELAASAKAEQQRQAQRDADAADPLDEDLPAQVAEDSPAASAPAPATSTASTAAAAPAGARYVLQAGAFSASGDAESLKARIALLGLSARVESAQIGGKTVYRVRMGPYGSASELAQAKQKLGSGGLPALAIKVQ